MDTPSDRRHSCKLVFGTEADAVRRLHEVARGVFYERQQKPLKILVYNPQH